MKTNFNVSQFTLILLILGIQIPMYLLLSEGVTGIIMIGFLVILLSYTLLQGAAGGLFWSLPYLFLLGAALFYSQISSTLIVKVSLPFSYFMVYGVSLICLILLAGVVQEQINGQVATIRNLKEKIRQFVAVDVETGFDNTERMQLEVDAEMKRIDRYGGSFILLILQVDYYQEFQKLYGEKERKHLLSSLAYALQQSVRQTDRKFRYAEDSLAVLLPSTSEYALDIVKEKLVSSLKYHQLLTGKQIEVTLQVGHVVYHQNSERTEYETLIDKIESERMTHVV